MPTPPLSDPTRPSTTDLLDALETLDHAGVYLPAGGFVDPDLGRPEPHIWAAMADGDHWRFTRWLTFEEAFGWSAPTDVDAVGVLARVDSVSRPTPGRGDDAPRMEITTGQPHEGREPPTPDIPPVAVRLVGAVDREGTAVSRLRAAEGVWDHQPCGGRLLDILLRCLDLPTPPPAGDTKRLLAALWLADLLEEYAFRGRRRLSWRDAVARHPLALTALPGAVAKLDPDGLAALAAAEDPPPPSWAMLRDRTARSGLSAELLPGRRWELAGWMDDGAYARWVLGEMADPLTTWTWVYETLTPHARARVAIALSRLLDLPGSGVDV